jgi:hypothetical protein
MQKIHSLLLVFVTLVLFSTARANCPLGAKEDHLTIQRVMRNFGRFVSPADLITLKGVTPYQEITEADLSEATTKLSLAIDCAQAVLDNPTGEILPAEYRRQESEAARQEYLDDFLSFMGEFRDGLKDYEKLFQELILKKPEERNYQPLREKCLELEKMVDHAHRKV